jgi:hypothetical protein
MLPSGKTREIHLPLRRPLRSRELSDQNKRPEVCKKGCIGDDRMRSSLGWPDAERHCTSVRLFSIFNYSILARLAYWVGLVGQRIVDQR